MDCLFCKIVNKEIPSETIYEDDKIIVFKDINPEAPFHVLLVPKVHIKSALELDESNVDVIGHIFLVAKQIAKEEGFSQDGYRIVNNCGQFGGQTVDHIHFHMLSKRNLNWPPG